jgi:hypothetical protein|tara:strand:- start:291 stop:509 length:219 start_codon:yes stop_codon:yes gene_type:complete
MNNKTKKELEKEMAQLVSDAKKNLESLEVIKAHMTNSRKLTGILRSRIFKMKLGAEDKARILFEVDSLINKI